MINEQLLNTFLTLVEIGHFTKTAKALYMTQPGVSQHIKKLEEEIGVSLINRFGKKFELTQAGQKLYDYGIEKKQNEARLFDELQFDSVERGECRFASSGSISLQLYPVFLSRQKKYTELSIDYKAAPNSTIVESILSNQTDIGIVTQLIESKELSFERVATEQLCLVLPSEYSKKKVTISTLNDLGMIDHPDCYHYAQRLLSVNFDDFTNIESMRLSGSVNQIHQILTPVALGIGFTVIPRSVVNAFNNRSDLYVLKLKNNVEDNLYIVKKEHRDLPKRFGWFESKIKSVLR